MLYMDIGGNCFICAHRCDNSGDDNLDVNLSNIYRYLGVNVSLALKRATSCNLRPIVGTNPQGAQSFPFPCAKEDLSARTCARCSDVCNQVSTLYHELQVLQLRLNYAVQTLHVLLQKNEEGDVTKLEARQVGGTSEGIQAQLVSILREETKHKCAATLSSMPISPQVMVEKLDGRKRVKIECDVIGDGSGVYDDSVSELDGSLYESSPMSEEEKCEEEEEAHLSLDLKQNTQKVDRAPPELPCLALAGLFKNKSKESEDGGGYLYCCSYCPKKIKQVQNLKSHVISQHPEELLPNYKPAGMEDQLWGECMVQMIDKTANWAPESGRVEAGKQPHLICILCLEKRSNRASLRIHLVTDHLDVLRDKLLMMVEGVSTEELVKKADAAKRERLAGWLNKRKERIGEKLQLTGNENGEQEQTEGRGRELELSLNALAASRKMVRGSKVVWSCPFCEKSLSKSAHLREHLVWYHAERFLSRAKGVVMDDVQFKVVVDKMMSNTQAEEKGKEEDKSFPCEYCDNIYRTRRLVLCHLLEVHNGRMVALLEEIISGEAGVAKAKRKCEMGKECGEGVSGRKQMRRDVEQISSWSNQTCVVTRQLRKEAGRYLCTHCSYTVGDVNSGRIHLIAEHPDKLFSFCQTIIKRADVTDEQFKTSCKTLLEREAGDPKFEKGSSHFVCRYCSMRYSKAWLLKAHLLGTHIEKGGFRDKLMNIQKDIGHETDLK